MISKDSSKTVFYLGTLPVPILKSSNSKPPVDIHIQNLLPSSDNKQNAINSKQSTKSEKHQPTNPPTVNTTKTDTLLTSNDFKSKKISSILKSNQYQLMNMSDKTKPAKIIDTLKPLLNNSKIHNTYNTFISPSKFLFCLLIFTFNT